MEEGEVVKVTAYGLEEDWKVLCSLSDNKMIIQKVKRDFQPLATTGLPLLDQTVESRLLAMKTSKAYKRI